MPMEFLSTPMVAGNPRRQVFHCGTDIEVIPRGKQECPEATNSNPFFLGQLQDQDISACIRFVLNHPTHLREPTETGISRLSRTMATTSCQCVQRCHHGTHVALDCLPFEGAPQECHQEATERRKGNECEKPKS